MHPVEDNVILDMLCKRLLNTQKAVGGYRHIFHTGNAFPYNSKFKLFSLLSQ